MTGRRTKTAGKTRPKKPKKQNPNAPRRSRRKKARARRKPSPTHDPVRLRPGEIVIPPEVLTPALMEELARIYEAAGLEIQDYVIAGIDDD